MVLKWQVRFMEDVDMLYIMVGKRVRQLRLRRNLTQEQLAERAGISTSFLGHIERGSRKLSLETFYRLIRALDCSANALLPMEGDAVRRSALELLRCAAALAEAGDAANPPT